MKLYMSPPSTFGKAAWVFIMAMSGISAASAYLPGASTPQVDDHRQGKSRPSLISDLDAQGSSIASAPRSTGKIGSKIDIAV